jgi:hypothetical protein
MCVSLCPVRLLLFGVEGNQESNIPAKIDGNDIDNLWADLRVGEVVVCSIVE